MFSNMMGKRSVHPEAEEVRRAKSEARLSEASRLPEASSGETEAEAEEIDEPPGSWCARRRRCSASRPTPSPAPPAPRAAGSAAARHARASRARRRHHAMRLMVLNAENSTFDRVAWYLSSLVLVFTQVLVLVAFTSSLSFKRCTSSEDCLVGSYCAGKLMFKQMEDGMPSTLAGGMISKGSCFPCGSRAADGVEVLKLLENTCVSMGYTDVAAERSSSTRRTFLVGQSLAEQSAAPSVDCVKTCTSNCTLTAVAGGPPDSQHINTYSGDELLCASSCAATCTAALPAAAQTALAQAARKMGEVDFAAHRTAELHPFLAWRATALQCSECPASFREGVAYMTAGEYEALTVMKMSLFDYVALLLAAVIVALTVFREIRDINVGEFMTRQRAAGGGGITWAELGVRYAIGFVTFLRRYVITTSVLTTVVLMVTRLGGDTVSVMLNTMATLFMLELDNLSFECGLAVLTKQKIERAWSVVIGPKQRALLTYSRRYHVVLLTAVIPVLIGTVRFIETSEERSTLITYVFLGIIAGGELIELQQVWPRRTRSSNMQRVGCYIFKVGAIGGIKWVLLKHFMHNLPMTGW